MLIMSLKPNCIQMGTNSLAANKPIAVIATQLPDFVGNLYGTTYFAPVLKVKVYLYLYKKPPG